MAGEASEWGFLVNADHTVRATNQGLPNTETASFEEEQLHDLTILREFGRIAMSLIVRYLNKYYERQWSDAQVVRVWKKLRQEQEKNREIPVEHVLFMWRDIYRATSSNATDRALLDETKNETLEQFFDTMSTEFNDKSEFSIDDKLDREADDNVTVLRSTSKGWGDLVRDKKMQKELFPGLWDDENEPFIFAHPKGNYSPNENIEIYKKRKECQSNWKTDMFLWTQRKLRGFKGEDLGQRPSRLLPGTTELNRRYYYKAPQPGFLQKK